MSADFRSVFIHLMSLDLAPIPAALKALGWLKEVITTALVVAVPDLDAPYFVVTYASGF